MRLSGESAPFENTRLVLFGLFLVSCTPLSIGVGADTASTDAVEDSGGTPGIDTGSDDDSGDVEQVGGVDDDDGTLANGCADFYDPELLPSFELTISQEVWADIQSDCSSYAQTYRPVAFTYGEETVDAMVRLKGNWSWSCEKLQFVISFNEADPDARFHGVRKLVLDAPWYDHTLLHERLAFPLFEARGLPYSCANNARLVINGEYYGLYANLEKLDREYLERHFDDPDGNLYQGGTELETNEDKADTSRLTALQASHTVEEIAALVDLDQAVAEWAMEAMIPAMDNYWAGVEINYYLYDEPDNGFVYLPYDLDIAFRDSAYTDGTLIWPEAVTSDPITYEHVGWLKEALFETVLADSSWCARFVEELEAARALYDPDELVAQVEEWDAQIIDALSEDKHKQYSDARHEAAVEDLKRFFGERADYVDLWLATGGHCPAQW